MRSYEILKERTETSWIRPWIATAVAKIGNYKNDLEWYTKFFKNLNASKELAAWKEQHIDRKLSIKHKMLDRPDVAYSVINAEHEISGIPIEHTVTVEVNVAHAPTDEKTTKNFIDRLSSIMVHEFAHASQRTSQIKKATDDDSVYDIETDVWKKQPPVAHNERDKYYIYMLNNMERDAWVAQIANDIHNAVGDKGIGLIDNILKQAQRQDYAVVGSKIIQVPNLNVLWNALGYYGRFLKTSKEGSWNKIKKELYRYLSNYNK